MLRKTRTFLLTFFITLTLLILFHSNSLNPSPPPRPPESANATLGFGTILAVSRPQFRREDSLLWAANLTELSITVPSQPAWTEADLRAFHLEDESAISNGSALAWLGHLNALRQILETEKATALVIEDDVDWDISVRVHQVPLLAAAIRKLLHREPTANTEPANYWAPTDQWDALYPGHCDDLLPPTSLSDPFHPLHHPHLLYADNTAPPFTLLHPDTSNFLRALGVPSGTRILHRTFAPFCTFAYAINRRSASTILREFAARREGVSAFDVQLLEACRHTLRCFSVSPELFHHGDGGSAIASVDSGGAGVGGLASGLGKGTWNVGCGARHGQLWVARDDDDGRARAKRVVGDMLERGQGECPIDLLRAERSWKGCEWGQCGAQS
ncbi:hypothetical protein EKO04_010734 [Ascochyta lentis]|uniref:Glycosyltransferase family 25 protein n=1 Tax=Ascochyta lentis TaxID=205686 RepID=A0A8H7ITU0_9PLEO|nr:hypothetical protein EKO04_010734 [Ascochyta lentis]